MVQFVIGFFLAGAVAYAAYLARSLSPSGAIAAVFVGGIIFGVGGWPWAVLLLGFFISSSALTKAFKKRKAGLNEKFSKGGQRDAAQVMGNGGLAAVFAAFHFFYPASPWLWLGFAASLAAVNADTWATELGVLNSRPPRLITNLAVHVEKGTSGGITVVGTLAALGGSALIALLAVLVVPDGNGLFTFMLLSLAGLLGSLFDSFLGATVQAIYYCPACAKETERHPIHSCGTHTDLKRGFQWINNDFVNMGCSIAAAVFIFLVGKTLF